VEGESDVDHLIEPMVAELDAKGLIGRRPGRADHPGRPRRGQARAAALLVVSSEGSACTGRPTWRRSWTASRRSGRTTSSIAWTSARPTHFEIVFRAAYLAGYAAEGQLEHIGFGTMNGPDGKPFKTREGGVLKLNDLIEMTAAKARERLHEAGLGEDLPSRGVRGHRRQGGGRGAEVRRPLNFRGTSYVFDLDRFTSFEARPVPTCSTRRSG
jgi:arginyl-tRNA synthetase